MNKNIFFVAILMIAVCLSGCSPLKKMKKNADKISYSAQPAALAVMGDEVPLTLNANFAQKYFKKKVLLTMTPLLTYDTGEMAFNSYTVQGEKVRSNNNVIPFTNGGSIKYNSAVPYTDDLRAAEFAIRAVAQKPNGKKTVEFPLVKLGNGVNATAKLADKNGTLMLAPDSYQQITQEAVQADIKYIINESAVRNSETGKKEVKQFLSDVASVVDNDRAKIVNTQISAYASPDGDIDLNSNLANARQQTAKSYFSQQMRKAKTPELAGDILELLSTPEDWDGFKELMEASNIADKQLILRVLSMYDDPVVREREIKNIASAYEEVKNQILPQLRRSKMIVNYELTGLSLDEIKAQYAADPSKLTANQMLFLAAATDDINQKILIYEASTKQFADDFRTWTNLAVANLEAGNLAAAKQAAAAAQKLNDADASVKNTLAVIAMRDGDLAKAQEILASAAANASDEIKANLGTINIMQGKYNEAQNYLTNVKTESAALSQLLNNQNDAAQRILNDLEPSAQVSYMKAIVAARKNDTVALYQNLKDAIAADAAYKKAALTDVEFAKYVKEAAFLALVK